MKERKEKKRTSRESRKQQKPRPSRLAVDRRFVSYLAEVNVLALLTNWFLSVYKYLVSVSNLKIQMKRRSRRSSDAVDVDVDYSLGNKNTGGKA